MAKIFSTASSKVGLRQRRTHYKSLLKKNHEDELHVKSVLDLVSFGAKQYLKGENISLEMLLDKLESVKELAHKTGDGGRYRAIKEVLITEALESCFK